MKKLTIPISGISRNTDDAISADGQCIELINARPKNGSIEPIGRPILEQAFTGGKTPVFIHKGNGYENVISRFGNDVIFDCARDEGYTMKNESICTLPELAGIESIGNMVIMATADSIHYALYKNGHYEYLGDRPEDPDIHFLLSKDSKVTESDDIWCNVDPDFSLNEGIFAKTQLNETSVRLVNDSFRGMYHKFLKEKIYGEGKVVFPVICRYAVRMFDGNYIMHSPPVLLFSHGGVAMNVVRSLVKDGKLCDFSYRVTAYAKTILVKYNTESLSKWKDIISSVDIFMSKPIPINDIDRDITTISGYSNGIAYMLANYFSTKDLIEQVENTSNFYLVKSIPINESSRYYENILQGNVTDNLEQKEAVTDDAFTRNRITGKIYTYNGRLHVGDVKMKIAPAHHPRIFVRDGNGLDQVNTEVHINTENGLKIVHGVGLCRFDFVNPYISYPDTRAIKMVIYGKGRYKEFALKPHPFLNIAYSLDRLDFYEPGDFSNGTYNTRPEDNIEAVPNKLKVSEVSNPIYFPAAQTYSVSSRKIIGMATATTALSTGQFGQFPLYVFTDEGIYALSTGTNGIAYSNSYPVSRDCCNNPSSITSTDNAVVFSSGRGLMMLSGSTINKLSDNIEGFLPSSIDNSPIIKKISDVAGLRDSLSATEFVYFLEKAVIGYNYEDKEIIVSNPSYKYSYVYSLESGIWYKISVSISSFINSYPECFAIFTDHGMYNMHNSHRTVNKILLLTRPVKFGSITHKRILQSAIRGVVKPSQSNLYFRGESVKFRDQEISIFSNCGFYILGSNDAEHFTLLSGREKLEDIRDLITKMNKTHAYKYFMFCIAGGVRTDVSLNYIEVMVDETFQNRLR